MSVQFIMREMKQTIISIIIVIWVCVKSCGTKRDSNFEIFECE